MNSRDPGGRGLVPVRSFSRARQEVNGRVSDFLHEAFLCFTQQDSLSLTPPSAWRKRQASRYRSDHVLTFAGDGFLFSYGNHAKKPLEEVKGGAHRISRGVCFSTKENHRLARENDCLASDYNRHASARTSPGGGAADRNKSNFGCHCQLAYRYPASPKYNC